MIKVCVCVCVCVLEGGGGGGGGGGGEEHKYGTIIFMQLLFFPVYEFLFPCANSTSFLTSYT